MQSHKIYLDPSRRENGIFPSANVSTATIDDASSRNQISVDNASFLLTKNDAKIPQKITNKDKRALSFLTEEMRLYVLYAMTHRSDPTKNRMIVCEKCGRFDNLELHHNKYFPEEIYLDDIVILCSSCHRGSRTNSMLRTIYEKDVRYCEMAQFKFAY